MKEIGVVSGIASPAAVAYYTCFLHVEARCLSKHPMDWPVAEAT